MPNILVSKIPGEPFLDYSEFVRVIKQFSTFEFLCFCNRIANWIDQRRTPDLLVTVPPIARYHVAHGSQVYLEPAVLAFLAKESILHGNDHRHGALNRDIMVCLFYLNAVMKEARIEPGSREGPGLLLRGYEQHKYQVNMSRFIPRVHLMLIEGNRTIAPEKKLLDLDKLWHELTGLTLESS